MCNLGFLSDFVSWRNMEWGTWFIQAVVFVFSHLAHKYDLMQLMTKVSMVLAQPHPVWCYLIMYNTGSASACMVLGQRHHVWC